MEKSKPQFTPLLRPSLLSGKLSGAFAQNGSNSVSADFLSTPNFTTLYILYFLGSSGSLIPSKCNLTQPEYIPIR